VVEVTTPVEVTAVHDEDANRTAHSRSKSTTSLPTVLCETTIPEVKALPAVDLAADTPLKGTAEDASPIPHRLVSHRRVNSSPGASLGQPTSTLTETGGDRSPAQVTDKLFKLEARLGTLEAHSTLGSAAYDWVSMLVKGVQEHIASCEFDEDELRIDLHTALTGEIATRSRVPVQFELADQIIVKLVVGDEGAVALKVSGLYFGPVGGAMECWDRLREVWAEAGAMDDASKKEVAWRWWQHDGHKKDFEGTKLWRVIESLVGLRSATLIPTKDMQDVLMGCICSTRKELRQLDFSHFSPLQGGESKGNPAPQVLATTRGDPANLDPSSRHYDSDSELRLQMSKSILMSHLGNPMKREMAERFCKSGINFGRLIVDVNSMNLAGSSPESFCKLFTVSDVVGGATFTDRAMGALAWQKDDITFKMSGEHGRVLWTPLTLAP